MIEYNDKAFEELEKSVVEAFENEFGMAPFWMAAAPSRVNLIGEHIDYCDGFVLPLAINRHVIIAAAPNGTSQANLIYTLFPDRPATVMLDEDPVRRKMLINKGAAIAKGLDDPMAMRRAQMRANKNNPYKSVLEETTMRYIRMFGDMSGGDK